MRSIAVGALALAVVAGASCSRKQAEQTQPTSAAMSQQTVYDFSLSHIDGKPAPLSEYRGKVLLIVNVASECGYTPQYAGLQQLHERYGSRGLVVMGIPCNDFGRQEPGTSEEIQAFCSSKYGITFPLFEKVTIKGRAPHPLYQWLTSNGDSVAWNFNKFLIDRQGKPIRHFGSRTEPLSSEMTQAIEALL
jgi:glutathione peroxidase